VQRGATTWDRIGDTVKMWPSKPDEQENFLRDLILTGIENEKLDFKEQFHFGTAEQKVKILKHLCAIANTDFDDFGGYGFIIFGAARSTLVGGIQAFDPVTVDKTSSALSTDAHNFLAPCPRFQLISFKDTNLGSWGAIVIPPSETQPHIFIRQLDGVISPGDWFVRAGDNTRQAVHADYLRILSKSVARAVQPLQTEVTKLTERVSQLEGRLGELQDRQPLVELELLNPFDGKPLDVVNIRELTLSHHQAEFSELVSRIKKATKYTIRRMESSNEPQSVHDKLYEKIMSPKIRARSKHDIQPGSFNLVESVLADLEISVPNNFFQPEEVYKSSSILSELPGLRGTSVFTGQGANWFRALQDLDKECKEYFAKKENAEDGDDFWELVFDLKNAGKGPLEKIELQIRLEPIDGANGLKFSYSNTPKIRDPFQFSSVVSPVGGAQFSEAGTFGWWDLGTLQPKADLEPKFGHLDRSDAEGHYILHVKLLANNLPDPFERSFEIIC
jgi:Putative DNA-binding domain